MKRVVSVSIGSSRRNHVVETEIRGEIFQIERVGTDGSLARAEELIRELDGKIAAFGLGGIDLYLYAGDRRYTIKDARRLAEAARITPVADGSGLKQSLERKIVYLLADDPRVRLRGRNVLLVSALDRYGMAEAFAGVDASLCMGDAMFALGVPLPIRSFGTIRLLARLLLPVITRLPFEWIYPTGSSQVENTPRFESFFAAADVIAGDFLYIHRYMPTRLDGKIILTNTVTREDRDELSRRGAAWLVTTTPELNGRSFGTNVMEALLLALTGKRSGELSGDDYLALLEQIGFSPRVENLQATAGKADAGSGNRECRPDETEGSSAAVAAAQELQETKSASGDVASTAILSRATSSTRS